MLVGGLPHDVLCAVRKHTIPGVGVVCEIKRAMCYAYADAYATQKGAAGNFIDKASSMLQAEWRLDNVLLQSLLRKALLADLAWGTAEKKLHLPLANSRYLIVISDDYGVLLGM